MMTLLATAAVISGVAEASTPPGPVSNNASSEVGSSFDMPPNSLDVQQHAANMFLEPIDGAMASIGAKCDEYKRGRSKCKWENISYTIMKPDDWDKEIGRFRSGCESGVFSSGYNVISNEKSWIVSASNGAEPTTNMHAALVKQGGMRPGPKLVKLCDLYNN